MTPAELRHLLHYDPEAGRVRKASGMNKSNVMLHRAEKLMRFRAAEYYAGLVARGIIGTPIGQAPEWMAVWRENNLDGPARRMEAAPKLIWC